MHPVLFYYSYLIYQFHNHAKHLSNDLTVDVIKESPQLTHYAVSISANRMIKFARLAVSTIFVFGLAKTFKINTRIDDTADYKLLVPLLAFSFCEQNVEDYMI
jgi:hypothetical protein